MSQGQVRPSPHKVETLVNSPVPENVRQLRQFVNKYIAHCLVCISKKRVPRSPNQNITSWEKPDSPFHTVHMDVFGPLTMSDGYKFISVVVDASTKFCLLYPIYRQDVSELKQAFIQAVSLFGVPKLIVTDRG